MPTNPLADVPAVDREAFDRTRRGLHALAEQVLAADEYRYTGRIGLRPTPGGIGTPWAIVEGAKRCARVERTEIVLIVGEERTAEPVSTVRAAAAVLGIEPGAPPVYTPATPIEPDRVLELDEACVATIADWYEFGAVALDRFVAVHGELSTEPILWPEHFDLAVTVPDEVRGEIVVGVSPGDDADPDPYAYVGWQGFAVDADGRPVDDWWNRPWGRWVPASAFETVDDLVDLFDEGFQRIR
ncbi:hypothetical protein [Dermatobacter hominis]|uniref:hypothetical protein n=1 Tax=Dermatobacter hominis TaxID=2884263 RepID=UPI001D11B640|nr:hypothetical protein [Dermatobacter hominis]UDY36508.1 hypothetical protein LH044_02975 [Dermatobacter hominis]